MYLIAITGQRRERLWRLGSAVRARIYREIMENPADSDAVDAISYPDREEPKCENPRAHDD